MCWMRSSAEYAIDLESMHSSESHTVRIFSPKLPARHFFAPWLVGSITFGVSVLFFRHAIETAELSKNDKNDVQERVQTYMSETGAFVLAIICFCAGIVLMMAPVFLRKKSAAKLVFDETNQTISIQRIWFLGIDGIVMTLFAKLGCIACWNVRVIPEWLRNMVSVKQFPMSAFVGSDVLFEHDALVYGDVRAKWVVKFIVSDNNSMHSKKFVLDETISKANSDEIA